MNSLRNSHLSNRKVKLSESNSVFEDAQQTHKQYPDTFSCPTRIELSLLKIGDYVKVCTSGERFWVIITSIFETNVTGTIDNDLLNTNQHHLKYGDSITFNKNKIYTIET